MLSQHAILRRLTLASMMVGLTGCISTGTRVTEQKDPFLPANPAVVLKSKVTTEHAPLAQPTKAKGSAQANETSNQPQTKLVAFEEVPHSANAEELVTSPIPILASPSEMDISSGVFPIDLANSLSLGGADNLQVRIARTQLYQAQAKHFEAKTLWLPSIRVGVGYNKHDGRLQETEGGVLEIGRNSLFYGGGLGLGDAPLAAGAGGPPRMFVNLSIADAYFKPLAASQEVAASGAAERVATNDSLAQIAIGYHSLVEAHGLLANANAAREMTQEMVGLVENFEREGFSSKTEVHRARTALADRRREVSDFQRETVVRSAELARILRLPAQVQLVPVEEFVLPVDFVDMSMETDGMIAAAWQSRPEISQFAARREAACFRVQEEKWRPWIPSVQVGASAGGFGGGPSTQFPTAAGRSDVDLIAVWELKNMGLGNVALQRQRRGQLHERVLDLEAIRDRIAAEVVAASADVASYRQQVGLAREAIESAQESYQLNEQRIRANEGLPIELLQSISALADARDAYTEAVANYNRAQYRLIRAMGNPADAPTETVASK
ncbi:MAG: TolC family protein [Planctomycetes bacterium]|nr:TolC family protein [Planctomycetota bacterium]